MNSTRVSLKQFLMPALQERVPVAYESLRIAAIVPTYNPDSLSARLVEDLIRWNPRLQVYVVDDCTPKNKGKEGRAIFRRIASLGRRVTLLRTPRNTLKAGALNYALSFIARHAREYPDVILTLDDDVAIAEHTVRNLVTELMGGKELGAVCSQCRVLNKNANILTRLQGLEYLGFNAIRMADEGFFGGPLVMHGMLTAFRGSALREVGGFSEGHLIEDYEVTTRLKEAGWRVKSCVDAPAWTVVPEDLPRLWRQRTRWSYGGIRVVVGARRLTSVFQDVLGHSIFIAMLGLIGILLFRQGGGDVPPLLADTVIALSLLQLGVAYAFQLYLMRFYTEKDIWDWIIRLTLLPEFFYSYLMTLALIGSYIFHSFNVAKRALSGGSAPERLLVGNIERLFRIFGYTEGAWGTRRAHL